MPFVLNDPTQTSPEIHVDDIGTQFIVRIYNQNSEVQDLSDATNLEIIFYSPSHVSKVKTAEFLTNGTDGKILYTFVDGDIDEKGNWSYQALITFPSGKWSTNIESFTVYANLPTA